jgi:hypothetical protein
MLHPVDEFVIAVKVWLTQVQNFPRKPKRTSGMSLKQKNNNRTIPNLP